MRVAFALLLVTATAVAQETGTRTIVLDAAEKHIVRSPYHADEAVTLAGRAAGGWHVYAGAAIDAGRIDLRMRNVRGQVRIRADASRLRNALARWNHDQRRR